jgi:capsular exopolysaccharide synthesis family protein
MTATEQGADWEGVNPGGAPRFANPMAIAWRRKGVLALGLVAGAVAGVLYYSQSTPVYQSQAKVLVIKKQPNMMPMQGVQAVPQMYVEDYLATHSILISSQMILRRAGKILEADHPGVIPPGHDAAAFIGLGLTVARDVREGNTAPSNVLNVSFKGRESADCPKVVNAVIRAYSEFLNETYGDLNREFAQQMKKAQDLLQSDIQKKQDEHDAIAQRDPLALKAKDALASLQERIAKLDGRLAELSVRKDEIKSTQEMISGLLKKGESRGAILKIVERSTAIKQPGPEVRTPEDMLLALQLQEEELKQDLGKDHPQMISLRHRVEALKERLSKLGNETPAGLDPLEFYVRGLDLELEQNELQQKKITQVLTDDRTKALETAKYLLEEEKARKAIEPLQQLYDNIIARLQQIRLTNNADMYSAQTIVDANVGIKVAPSLLQTLALAGIAGLMLGMGLAYLAEFTDKGFRSPEEIRQRLGVQVVGHVPPLPEAGDDADPRLDRHLVVFHAPGSREAESFRGMRTSLYFSTQGRGHQVIQMTSPTKGDGKSTLLANLAITIAQSGKRVILLDADFRRPTVHKLFHLPGDANVGLASVLTGQAELPDALRPCEAVPGLSLLPCGPRPTNPAELLTSVRFQELLGVLRDRADFVLVDTPPLLAVSDPASVAPFVDGVLMTVRLSKSVRPQAERANDILASLGAHLLGVVVNGTAGYGPKYNYAYSYGYSYGYGYNYGYEAYDEPAARPAEAAKPNGTLPSAS